MFDIRQYIKATQNYLLTYL